LQSDIAMTVNEDWTVVTLVSPHLHKRGSMPSEIHYKMLIDEY